MIIFCRDCLLDGVEMADVPAYGTIHNGQAICIPHFKQSVDPVLAERIPMPMVMQMAEAGRC